MMRKQVQHRHRVSPRVMIMTDRKRRIFDALNAALEYCGYNLDALMAEKCRERLFADLRAIVWHIYQSETNYSSQQISEDFNWNRGTIFSAVRRANDLRGVDRNFTDMYDSIHGAYINAYSMSESTTIQDNINS